MEDPISAILEGQPQEVYARLAQQKTLSWSQRHQRWVAAHPQVVREVLEDPGCAVRPAEVRVPQSLFGTRAGAVFGRLVRMTEGNDHDRAKRAISSALGELEPSQVRATASRAASIAMGRGGGSRFPFDVSAYTLGQLLGVLDERLQALAEDAGGFARCLSPAASGEEIAEGIAATDRLWQMVAEAAGQGVGPLTVAMTRTFSESGLDHEAMRANMIGFLFQAHDAVAGLIGNTVVHLTRENGSAGVSLRSLATKIAHVDPSIQNTRRFVEREMEVAGQRLRAGDTILVVLASDAGQAGGSCPFGHGRHACPGQEIAITIAETAVEELVRRGAIPDLPDDTVRYRPSMNARIPILDYVPTGERGT